MGMPSISICAWVDCRLWREEIDPCGNGWFFEWVQYMFVNWSWRHIKHHPWRLNTISLRLQVFRQKAYHIAKTRHDATRRKCLVIRSYGEKEREWGVRAGRMPTALYICSTFVLMRLRSWLFQDSLVNPDEDLKNVKILTDMISVANLDCRLMAEGRFMIRNGYVSKIITIAGLCVLSSGSRRVPVCLWSLLQLMAERRGLIPTSRSKLKTRLLEATDFQLLYVQKMRQLANYL